MQRKIVSPADALQFQSTFGVSVGQFHHPITGFDIIAFDANLATPDGVSTRDYITAKHGKAASDLIFRLIKAS